MVISGSKILGGKKYFKAGTPRPREYFFRQYGGDARDIYLRLSRWAETVRVTDDEGLDHQQLDCQQLAASENDCCRQVSGQVNQHASRSVESGSAARLERLERETTL